MALACLRKYETLSSYHKRFLHPLLILFSSFTLHYFICHSFTFAIFSHSLKMLLLPLLHDDNVKDVVLCVEKFFFSLFLFLYFHVSCYCMPMSYTCVWHKYINISHLISFIYPHMYSLLFCNALVFDG